MRQLKVVAAGAVVGALIWAAASATATAAPAPTGRDGGPGGNAQELVAGDYASIFAHMPAYVGGGWERCRVPISWTADTRGLSAAESTQALRDLRWALDLWSQAAGLTFSFAGTEGLRFDESEFTLVSNRTPMPGAREILFAFLSGRQTVMLRGDARAFGSPSLVAPKSRSIVAGTAIFDTAYIQGATPSQARSLYLHEIGHVLGLAHAHLEANVMYPVVTGRLALGPGDIAGVAAMTKPCESAAAG